ncbi:MULTISPECIES: hypothetical protein [unclassified Streptomyces]|uniref:hypothetical protein n=1 Tax=unclassified Streptomyces TaxID=2593676 RepID=UPI0022373EFF|nr:hypothetical protein [Streptomyces sp. SHP 1-2]MCW5252256.1 hypothetical protein [Streptomyces sp. SHP 1-2]
MNLPPTPGTRPEQPQASPERLGTTMLALPTTRLLSDDQRDGRACPWCAAPVTEDTGIDLGTRPGPLGIPIHPRGCAPCVHRVAHHTYRRHSTYCQRCERDPAQCEARRTLRRLAQEGTR